MSKLEITYRRESPGSEIARTLIAELDADLLQHYALERIFGLKPADFVDDGGFVFLVARSAHDGEAVGCVGLRLLGDARAEIKRMFVRPTARGFGIGRGLLRAIEQEAADLGVTMMLLETAPPQETAIRLYESAGYARVPCWGEYARDPISICYGKLLSPIPQTTVQ